MKLAICVFIFIQGTVIMKQNSREESSNARQPMRKEKIDVIHRLSEMQYMHESKEMAG